MAIEKILKEIVENTEGKNYSHKEVRAIARIALVNHHGTSMSVKYHDIIKFYLEGMAAYGLNHRDRSFAASQILVIIKKDKEEESEESMENVF